MTAKERLHAKRAATEDHIRNMEFAGSAGKRYTARMSDMSFLVNGLVCDIGWLLQLVFGVQLLAFQFNFLVALSLLAVIMGVAFTAYLGRIHEKEIALRYQKDLSFGLTVLGGIVGIVAGVRLPSTGFFVGAVLNVIGGAPIFLSFKKGIVYGIR